MSEEFCDGVKILLKRMGSNPEEFRDSDRWEQFTSPHNLRDGFWSHALSPEEIEALRDGMRKIYKDLFTKRVMAKLLEDKEVNLYPYTVKEVQPGAWVNVSGAGGGGSLGNGSAVQNVYNPYQNSISYPTRSAFAESQPPVKKPTLGEMLKQKLSLL